jgi:hypothetical protein
MTLKREKPLTAKQVDQSDKLVNQQQCETVLWLLPATASNANMLSQNNFFKPNWQVFTILHVVWVRMLLQTIIACIYIYIYIYIAHFPFY